MSGKFVGDLTNVDAMHAYWVKSKAPVKVSVVTPPLSPDKLPPTIPVVGGQWNLVPVISLAPIGTAAGEIQEGVELGVRDFFGANWTKAFTFDKGEWIGIKNTGDAPDDVATTLGDAAQIGRGYWVLFTKDDNITPGIK